MPKTPPVPAKCQAADPGWRLISRHQRHRRVSPWKARLPPGVKIDNGADSSGASAKTPGVDAFLGCPRPRTCSRQVRRQVERLVVTSTATASPGGAALRSGTPGVHRFECNLGRARATLQLQAVRIGSGALHNQLTRRWTRQPVRPSRLEAGGVQRAVMSSELPG